MVQKVANTVTLLLVGSTINYWLGYDWVETIMISRLKKLEGQKVLIGDYLASHLSVSSLNVCRDNEISFVCLSANSSPICQ